jgi:hypothetical protein
MQIPLNLTMNMRRTVCVSEVSLLAVMSSLQRLAHITKPNCTFTNDKEKPKQKSEWMFSLILI